MVAKYDKYTHGKADRACISEMQALADSDSSKEGSSTPVFTESNLPQLFKLYPQLQESLAYRVLGEDSIPLYEATKLGAYFDVKKLYIKEDHRQLKLGLLLADALKYGCVAVLVFGSIDSPYPIDVAKWAQQFGLKTICILDDREEPAPDKDEAYRNSILLLHGAYKTKHKYSTDKEKHIKTATEEFLQAKKTDKKFPYPIPAGGCPETYIGQAEAIFSLYNEIKKGEIDEPDFIIVPTGTVATGMLYGLCLLRALGVKSRFIAIDIRPHEPTSKMFEFIKKRFGEINAFLQEYYKNFPTIGFTETDLEVITNYGLGDLAKEGEEMKAIFKNLLHKNLQSTPTARALAALYNHVRKNNLHDKKFIFWYQSGGKNDCDVSAISPEDLDPSVHHFFENKNTGTSAP